MAHFRLGRLEFEWDDAKADSNSEETWGAFAEAATAFLDTFAEMIPDPRHSDEERTLLLAMSSRLKILVVVHVTRGIRIRIISARPATSKERRRYDATRIGSR